MLARLGPFLLSCLLAFTAGHMFNYTVILYLQEAVGSDLLSGLGFGLAFGSSIVFGWFGGVLCDRVAPHRVIHGAQALFLAGLACLWWAQSGAAPEVRVAWVLGGAFLGGLAWSFVGPARLTMLAQMARPEELRPATILFNLQVLVGFGLAPLLIGIVRSQSGWGAVIALGACGFGLSSLLIANLRTHANPNVSSNSVLADILEGFRTVGKDPLLTQLMLAAVLGYAMTGPLQILLPKLAREVLHLSELQRGAYLGLLALSLIVGGVTALAVAKRVRHGLVMFEYAVQPDHHQRLPGEDVMQAAGLRQTHRGAASAQHLEHRDHHHLALQGRNPQRFGRVQPFAGVDFVRHPFTG